MDAAMKCEKILNFDIFKVRKSSKNVKIPALAETIMEELENSLRKIREDVLVKSQGSGDNVSMAMVDFEGRINAILAKNVMAIKAMTNERKTVKLGRLYEFACANNVGLKRHLDSFCVAVRVYKGLLKGDGVIKEVEMRLREVRRRVLGDRGREGSKRGKMHHLRASRQGVRLPRRLRVLAGRCEREVIRELKADNAGLREVIGEDGSVEESLRDYYGALDAGTGDIGDRYVRGLREIAEMDGKDGEGDGVLLGYCEQEVAMQYLGVGAEDVREAFGGWDESRARMGALGAQEARGRHKEAVAAETEGARVHEARGRSVEVTRSRHERAARTQETRTRHHEDAERQETRTRHNEDAERQETRTRHNEDAEPQETRTRYHEDAERQEARTRYHEDAEPHETRARHREDAERQEARTRHREDAERQEAARRTERAARTRHHDDVERQEAITRHHEDAERQEAARSTDESLRARDAAAMTQEVLAVHEAVRETADVARTPEARTRHHEVVEVREAARSEVEETREAVEPEEAAVDTRSEQEPSIGDLEDFQVVDEWESKPEDRAAAQEEQEAPPSRPAPRDDREAGSATHRRIRRRTRFGPVSEEFISEQLQQGGLGFSSTFVDEHAEEGGARRGTATSTEKAADAEEPVVKRQMFDVVARVEAPSAVAVAAPVSRAELCKGMLRQFHDSLRDLITLSGCLGEDASDRRWGDGAKAVVARWDTRDSCLGHTSALACAEASAAVADVRAQLEALAGQYGVAPPEVEAPTLKEPAVDLDAPVIATGEDAVPSEDALVAPPSSDGTAPPLAPRPSTPTTVAVPEPSEAPAQSWQHRKVLVVDSDPTAAAVHEYLLQEATGASVYDLGSYKQAGRGLTVLVHGDWPCPTPQAPSHASRPPLSLLFLKNNSGVHFLSYTDLDSVAGHRCTTLFPHSRSCLFLDHHCLLNTHPDNLRHIVAFIEHERATSDRLWSLKIVPAVYRHFADALARSMASDSEDVERLQAVDAILRQHEEGAGVPLVELETPDDDQDIDGLQEHVLAQQHYLQRLFRHFCVLTDNITTTELDIRYLSTHGIAVLPLRTFLTNKVQRFVEISAAAAAAAAAEHQ